MVTCQVGAEAAVKGEVARQWPDFRFSYSRPGFLTFKLPETVELSDDFKLRSVFARAHAFSLGKAAGTDVDAMAQEAWRIVGGRAVTRIHAWSRDAAAPGHHGFEPSITAAALGGEGSDPPGVSSARVARPARCQSPFGGQTRRVGARLRDRRARPVVDRLPPGEVGGVAVAGRNDAAGIARRTPSVGRGSRWKRPCGGRGCRFPLGARVAEIGSAPGGASQALLARGFKSLGIDPAEMARSCWGIRVSRIFAAGRSRSADASSARSAGSRPT